MTTLLQPSKHPRTSRNATLPLSLSALFVLGAICGTSTASASPLLGSDLASFTILGSSTVTNVPTSTITGNVGVWSSGGVNAITGFKSSPGVATSDPQVTGGSVYAGGALAQSAQSELTTARNNLASLGSGTTLTNADLTLAGTLAPGVYTVPAGTTNLSGSLTLDGEGNANAVWVFQLPSTLITSPNSAVHVINAGSGAGVYWNVGSSATIDVNTSFMGNILALASVTMNTTATDACGRAFANTGAVTLEQNSLSGVCSGELTGSGGLSGGLDVTTPPGSESDVVSILPYSPNGPAAVPEPSTLALLCIGLAGLGVARLFARRRHS